MQVNNLKISKTTTIQFDFTNEANHKLTIRANCIDDVLQTDSLEVLVVDNWKHYDSLPVETIEILKREFETQILNNKQTDDNKPGKNKIKRNFMYMDIVPIQKRNF